MESKPSGTWICKGETFLVAKWLAENLHTAWRLTMNVYLRNFHADKKALECGANGQF